MITFDFSSKKIITFAACKSFSSSLDIISTSIFDLAYYSLARIVGAMFRVRDKEKMSENSFIVVAEITKKGKSISLNAQKQIIPIYS